MYQVFVLQNKPDLQESMEQLQALYHNRAQRTIQALMVGSEQLLCLLPRNAHQLFGRCDNARSSRLGT